jgi:hypothetical protein
MHAHSRFVHMKVDWSRGYYAPAMHKSRGYHGDPLTEDDMARIAATDVSPALEVSTGQHGKGL